MTSTSINYKRLIIASVIIWTLIALLGMLSGALYALSRDREVFWGHLFWYKYSTSLVWIILMPLLFWLTKVLPFREYKWHLLVAAHLLASIIIAPMHKGLSGSIDYFFQNKMGYLTMPIPSYSEYVSSYFLSNTIQGVITYFIVIVIIYGYRFYYQNLKAQVAQSKLEFELSNAKLHNLKSQLQPHFLFNTMQSISALMYQDIDKAESSMALLSDLLRISFQRDDRSKILLKEELYFTDIYLELLKLRYGKRLTVIKEINMDTMNMKVPVMILQPFIENSIKHGLEKHNRQGEIKIKISRSNQFLEINISDNGAIQKPKDKIGTGIINTKSRLSTLYKPNEYSFTHGFNENGYVVLIKIPAES